MLSTMRHLGILAHSTEGAALCFRAFCQEGFAELAPNEHPDVSLDCIALARSMPAWESGDYASIRATLAVSVQRLAAAGDCFRNGVQRDHRVAGPFAASRTTGSRTAHTRSATMRAPSAVG